MGRSRLEVLILLLLATACGNGEQEEAEPPPAPAEAVRGFDPDDGGVSIDRLNRASFAAPSSIGQLAPFLESEDGDRRFAAVYLAALLVEESTADLLIPVLEDPDLGLRVIAAGALAGVGVVESLPVLIEGLRSTQPLPYSDPPRLEADLAREALTAYTEESFASPGEWDRWWAEVENSVRWDGQRFVAG
jgi:hypothetical protein